MKPMSDKAKAEKLIERVWMDQYGDRCWACWVPAGSGIFYRSLQLAHLVGGSGRTCDPASFSCLCERDHSVFDGLENQFPPISMGAMLGLKLLYDPKHFDTLALSRMAGYKGGYMPEDWTLTTLPQFYQNERRKFA